MSFIDLAWHLIGLLAVPVLAGAIAAASAKALFRRLFGGVSLRALCLRTALAGAAVQACGLVVLGSDGRMGTYGTLALVIAVVLWWSARRAKAAP